MKRLPVVVQIKDKTTNRYIKIDRVKRRVVARKETEGPYKKTRIVKRI